MSDLIQLTAGKQQQDVQKQSVANQDDRNRSAAAQSFQDKQDAERASYGF
jgi:hypothetical protein